MPLIFSYFIIWLLPSLQSAFQEKPVVVEGATMGTSYRVIYFDSPPQRNFKASIDSLLVVVNQAINTYDSASEISRFNSSRDGIVLALPYLQRALVTAREVYSASGGAFDPTVMPLVNAWGFGPEKGSDIPNVDSLRSLVGFDKIRQCDNRLLKKAPGVQLDMGGIGQGFGADVVFEFLKSRGITDMLVELGGEGVAMGKNREKDKPWTIGILHPHSTPDHQFFKAYVVLDGRAFTTSGNYFNYRVVDGQRFGHTIDPVSGRPVQHNLLSASVFAHDCTSADAWATAFMVMGTDKAVRTVQTLPGIDAILMYSTPQGTIETYISPGIANSVTLEQ